MFADTERTLSVDDGEPVGGDVVPAELVHVFDVGQWGYREVLAWGVCLDNRR